MYQIYLIHSDTPLFPNREELISTDYDVICIGGELNFPWLIAAYERGYFPWFSPEDPVTWWHPAIRAVMRPEDIRIHKSMRPYFNQVKFHLRIDYAFEEVMKLARKTHLDNEGDTWISEDFVREYTRLHKKGYAHSFEAWKDGILVGGLYGLSLGRMFFGEAMFSAEKNASKFCFISLAQILQHNGFTHIDCQVPNNHLSFMGCKDMPRDKFLDLLEENKQYETIQGNWAKELEIPPLLEKHIAD